MGVEDRIKVNGLWLVGWCFLPDERYWSMGGGWVLTLDERYWSMNAGLVLKIELTLLVYEW